MTGKGHGMLTTRKALKKLILWVAAGCLLIAGVTVLFDPFYQYHGPILGMPEVLFERETQVIGSIRHFEYDSVLLGSSMVENCNGDYLDSVYGTKTLKVVKGSGSTADLMYYLGAAHEKQELKRVFYGLDLFALKSTCAVTVISEYSPSYLYTETFLDDGQYLFNKDVLLGKIPTMLGCALMGERTGGHAYDWSEGKEFSASKAMEAYKGPEDPIPEQNDAYNRETIAQNIALIADEIGSHPDTHYTIFFPPYSLLMWDDVVRKGELEEYCYMLDQVLDRLTGFANTEVYYFQAEKEIVYNLDLYMDTKHYSPDINQYMLTCMVEKDEEYLLTAENRQEASTALRQMCEEIATEEIYRYYPR